MKTMKCPECGGTGKWECDEDGNYYSHPKKCKDCDGTGVIISKEED